MDQMTYQHFSLPVNKSGKDTEYAIYTYKHYDDDKFGFNKWQRYKTVQGLNRAMREAKVLHRSQQFEKIEIKQKYFDKDANRSFSKTLKVFQKQPICWQKIIERGVLVVSLLTLLIIALL